MAYKDEHAGDLDTDIVVAATVHPLNAPDTQPIIDTAIDTAVNAEQAGMANDLQAIIGIGGPRSLQGLCALLQTAWIDFERLLPALDRVVAALVAPMATWSRAIGG
jgi:hypothetical protein